MASTRLAQISRGTKSSIADFDRQAGNWEDFAPFPLCRRPARQGTNCFLFQIDGDASELLRYLLADLGLDGNPRRQFGGHLNFRFHLSGATCHFGQMKKSVA
jgi:hypothetical protein